MIRCFFSDAGEGINMDMSVFSQLSDEIRAQNAVDAIRIEDGGRGVAEA